MRRILLVLRGLLQGIAWLVTIAAVGLFAFEEAGGLTRLARRELERRLGPRAAEIGIERVRLKWFEPGLVLEGLTLRGAPDGGKELLRLSSMHCEFDGYRRPHLRSILAEEGRIAFSSELLQTLDGLRDQWLLSLHGVPPAPLPPILAEDVAVELDVPGGPLRAGRIRMLARGLSDGSLTFHGFLVPEGLGPLEPGGGIAFEGRQGNASFEIAASASELPLASRDWTLPFAEPVAQLASFEGRGSFVARLRADRDEASGSLRATLRADALRLAGDRATARGVSLDVEATGRAARLEDLVELAPWTARARARGRWNETPVDAWAELETTAGEPRVRAFARAEELPLSEATLTALDRAGLYREPFSAFHPSGVADASVDVALRRVPGDGSARWEPSLAVHVRHVGRSGMTFEGYRDPLRGERLGFPLSCTAVRGQTLFVRDDRRALQRLACVDMSAEHPSGVVHAWASLGFAPQGDRQQVRDLDVVFESPGVAIDEGLRGVLEKSPFTRNIVASYDPRGGTVDTTWRLHVDPGTNGLSAAGHVRIRGASLRWSELPVPMDGTSGELELLFGRRASPVRDHPGLARRAFGISYALDNEGGDPARVGTRARIRGFARQPDFPEVVEAGGSLEPWIQGIELEIPEILLRGRDYDVLAERNPELRRWRDELKASGGVRVHFAGARASPAAAWISEIEVVPGEVQVQPRFFKRNTQDLTGRILARWEAGSALTDVGARLDLSGRWSGDVDLALHASQVRGRAADVQVLGAGIDPSNTAFQGALLDLFSDEEARGGVHLDLSQSRLSGRIDVGIRGALALGAQAPSSPAVARVFLRDNTLGHASLELTGMHGVFELSGKVLQSPVVLAELAGHPVQLEHVLVYALQDASRTPAADPLLERAGFPADATGLVLQAELQTRDLPLDEDHLRSFLDPSFLATLGPSSRGRIDVLGARIVLAGPADRPGILLVRGPLELHDLALALGLPITIVSAHAELEQFAFEEERFRGWARVTGLDALIADRSLTDASLVVGYVDGRLTIDALSGAFEREGDRGRLSSLGRAAGGQKALGVDLAEPFLFDVALELRSVPVDRLLRGVFSSGIADEGLLDADLQLAGTPGDVLGLHGRGHLHLTQGKLWSIPVIRELFSRLGFDQTLSFDELQARYELRDGVLTTPYLEIKSPLVNLLGNGWIDLDGRVHYDLDVRYGLLDRLGFLNRILYWMNRKIWRVEVRGNLSRPSILIRNSVLDFFRGDRDGAGAKLLPLPGFALLPERF